MNANTVADWASLIANVPAAAAAKELFEYLCPLDRPKVQRLFNDLNAIIASPAPSGAVARGIRSKLIGDRYEEVLRALFEQSLAVSFERNVQTSTDEIDLLFRVEPLGFTCVPLLNRAGTHFIGEAKCHARPPGSDLCHSLVGVLSAHQAKLAFLFVNCTSRKLQARARNAIAIHAAKGYEVVPLGRKQISEIISGAHVFKVLADQHTMAMAAAANLQI